MRGALVIALMYAVIIGAILIVAHVRVENCHRDGGDFDWSWSSPLVCLTPDGYYLRD